MKNKMYRLGVLLICMIMVFGMVSCTSKSNEENTQVPKETVKSVVTDEIDETETGTEAEPITITVSVQAATGVEEGWTAIAEAYEAMHENVDVIIDLKPTDGYAEWVQNVYTTEGASSDIININLAGSVAVGKSINFMEYAYNDSPYSEGAWTDQFNFQAQTLDLARNEWTALSLESVQVLWLYNKDIFEEVGVEAPSTWSELKEVCEKIYDAGYQPISLAGDYDSFWSGQMGWLAQIYADQTTRSTINLWCAQEGDYCYDPDVDGVWEYNPTDPYNDDSYKVNVNAVRMFKALADGEFTADTAGMRTVWNSFAEVFPKYAGGDNFFGTSDSIPLFYQGKAAMIVDGGWRLINFKNDMEKLTSGESVTSGEEIIEGVQSFRLGTFNMPSMEGDGIEASARTIEVPVGFVGAIKKDKSHDDAVVDLLMYYSSSEGQSLYLDAGLAVGLVPNGPSLVYDVELPADIQESFEDLSFIGNCQKGFGQKLARGMSGSAGDIDASYRAFYDYGYRFLNGEIDIEGWIDEHCDNIATYTEEAMTTSGVSASDLDNPQNAPAGQ